MLSTVVFWSLASLFVLCSALPFSSLSDENPYAPYPATSNYSSPQQNSLEVDLGYSIYRGTSNSSTGLDTWKGIRFAASPAGANRWQAPKVPQVERNTTIVADTYGPQCPQTSNSQGIAYQNGTLGDEDCLFLNVYAPPNTTTELLPVLVWIHGGGYGELNGQLDFSPIMNANNDSFVGVSIQYRLGAFGFLSSQEVYDNGVVNAGILDQFMALQWVQQYIHLFGGDPARVTISGESAGGGSVMLLDMAYGGTVGSSLFQNTIAASPYLPMQYAYNAAPPTSSYDAFVERSGCSSYSGCKFDCLVAASSEVLQNASQYVSTGGVFGTWAFLPVTDGTLIQDLPSRQLLTKRVNGQRMLTGNNAIEGFGFVPANLTTQDDVIAWLQTTFPMLGGTEIEAVLNQYPIEDSSITATSPRFATNGTTNPNANEVSPQGTGQNQRAYNIYSESTFVCPSYWLAEAYTGSGYGNSGPASYKYQYSVVPATHGQDVAGYFNPPEIPHSPDFSLAFKQIWGQFVTNNNPSISNLVANGQSTGNEDSNPAAQWPAFNQQSFPMMNLNETFTDTVVIKGKRYPSDGIMNDITLVDAYSWEAGRGRRCDFWRSFGSVVPEK